MQLQLTKLLTLFILLLITSATSVGQQNIAPQATISASGNGCLLGNCADLNDMNLGTCGTRQVYISTSNPPSTVIGDEYIKWGFSSEKTFDTLIIHHGSDRTGTLTGATVQYWDGANWATHTSFSNLLAQCVNKIGIGKLTTDSLRITLFEMNLSGPNQQRNPSFREIEIIEAPNAKNDAKVVNIDSLSYLCAGVQDVYATIQNYGTNQIDSLNVFWEVDGVLQNVTQIVGLLDTINGNFSSDTALYLGTFNFQEIVEIKVYTDLPNGVSDSINQNDTLIKRVGPGLSGIYTVDSSLAATGNNFKSLSSMSKSLKLVGVCGPTTINVANGVYNESLYLEKIPKASALNNVVIDGGDSSQTIINHDGSVNLASLTFDGVKHVTVKNMGIKATGANGDAVLFTGNSQNDTLSSCQTWVDPTNTNSNWNIGFSGEPQGHRSGNSASNIVIQNNRIIGGRYGISSSATKEVPGVGNQILNNELDSTYQKGIDLRYQDSLAIVGNSINLLNSSHPFTEGVEIDYANNILFTANYVWAKGRAVEFNNYNGGPLLKIKNELSNNMIYSEKREGLYLESLDSVDLWHNSIHAQDQSPTVRIDGSSNHPASFYDVRNNIFSSDKNLSFLTNVPDTIFKKLDNNIYYSMSGSNLLEINSVSYVDLASYQNAQPSYNILSLEADPEFVSATNLHIAGRVPNGAGDNNVNISVDIDGDPRPIPGVSGDTIVDIGADEFIPPSCVGPSNLSASKPGIASISLSWSASDLNSTFEYIVVPCGGNPDTASSSFTALDSIRVSGLSSNSCYTYYLREVCSRGDTSEWADSVVFYTVANVPYFEDFERFPPQISENPWPFHWESKTFPTPTGTSRLQPRWESQEGTGVNKNTVGTGPLYDHTKFGTSGGVYAFLNSPDPRSRSMNDSADFISTPILVDSNMSVLKLSYWYFMHGSLIDRMKIFVDTNGVENLLAVYEGEQQANQSDNWLKDSVYLAGYQGKSIRLKFRGYKPLSPSTPSRSLPGDVAIDDISIDTVGNDAYLPIGLLNTNNNNAEPSLEGLRAWTSGTVVGVNLNAGNGIGFTLIDKDSSAQEGIYIHSDTAVGNYNVTQGDSIKVRGTVGQLNGLTQLVVDSIVVISSGNAIPTPHHVEILDESTESQYLKMDTLILLNPSGVGSYSMRAYNGMDTITVWISDQTDISDSLAVVGNNLSVNDTLCMMLGVGGQNDTSATTPYLSAYQITPMRYSDLSICKSVSTPPSIPYYPIETINTVDSVGNTDSLNVEAWTSGTVVGVDLNAGAGLGFALIDDSTGTQEGIYVYSSNDVSNYTVTEGDSLKVRGTVDQFNGLTQFVVDSIEVISTGNAIPTARLVNNLDESTESQWLQMEDFVLLDSSQTGSYNMQAHNTTDTITIRINAQTDVSDSLADIRNSLSVGDTICVMKGIGGQFDQSSPYTEGYQITPMYFSAMSICKKPVGLETAVQAASGLRFYPNPTKGSFTIATSGLENDNALITIRDISGKVIVREKIINSSSAFKKHYTLEGQAKGLYLISIIDGEQRINKKLILQ